MLCVKNTIWVPVKSFCPWRAFQFSHRQKGCLLGFVTESVCTSQSFIIYLSWASWTPSPLVASDWYHITLMAVRETLCWRYVTAVPSGQCLDLRLRYAMRQERCCPGWDGHSQRALSLLKQWITRPEYFPHVHAYVMQTGHLCHAVFQYAICLLYICVASLFCYFPKG